jgi:hypothetical protein
MTSNGTEVYTAKRYVTSDSHVFYDYDVAVAHAIEESDKTSAGSYVVEYHECYY